MVRQRDESEENKLTEHSGIYGVATVAFANGGDNIGIYVPLFASVGFVRGIIVFAFLALVAVWCYVGYRMGGHPTTAAKLDRYGHIIVPFVLVGLSFYTLGASGALQRLLGERSSQPARDRFPRRPSLRQQRWVAERLDAERLRAQEAGTAQALPHTLFPFSVRWT